MLPAARLAVIRRLTRALRREDAFTLIELLVVITILGILAAIVVFAVRGIGDKGLAASVNADAATVRTAEEAYCAKNGSYGTVAQLRSASDPSNRFLASVPTYNAVVLATGNCGTDPATSGFVVGSPRQDAGSTAGPVIYVPNLAPNATSSPFKFLSSSFVAANGPTQFKVGFANTTANSTADPSLAFFGSDKATIDAITPSPTNTASPCSAGCGTCATASTCLGMPPEVQYAQGKLIIYSCAPNGQTIEPTNGTTGCTAPNGANTASNPGYLGTGTQPAVPTTPADLAADLKAPGSAFVLVVPNGSGGTAVAAKAAMQSLLAGGGALNPAEWTNFTGRTTPPRIILAGGGVSPQSSVLTGGAHAAMFTQSSVSSPAGDDTNNWSPVSTTLYSASSLAQYAVTLKKPAFSSTGTAPDPTAQAFLNYVVTHNGQAVLGAFGFQPLS